jgi:hypothetical protein
MFHSTIVMNFITWSSIVCAYPKSTLALEGLKNTYRANDSLNHQVCFTKYIKRGFTLYDTGESLEANHLCGESGYCGQTLRFITDSSTLRYSFADDPDTHTRPELIDRRLAWKLATKAHCKPPNHRRPASGFVHTGTGQLIGMLHVFLRKRRICN